MKKILSLALALALSLSLTVPAFAANQPGKTTVTDSKGNVYTLSKPIIRTISREDIEELPFAKDYSLIDGDGPVEMDSADSILNDVTTAYEVPIGTVVTAPNNVEFGGFGLVELRTVNGETMAVWECFEPPYLGELELDYRDLGWYSTFWILPCNAVTETHSGNQGTPIGNIVFYTSKVDSAVSFTDVVSGAYYYDAVKWAVEKNITSGTSATTFSPDAPCSRAQILTFLWRAAGSPEPKKISAFSDVKTDAYYAKAAAWAGENGMASGSIFSPDSPCTREMAVEFMWKYAGSPSAAKASFTDVSSQAVDWAVVQGVTSGTSKTTFSPDTTCTRAQIVTFLYRAFAK